MRSFCATLYCVFTVTGQLPPTTCKFYNFIVKLQCCKSVGIHKNNDGFVHHIFYLPFIKCGDHGGTVVKVAGSIPAGGIEVFH